MQVLRVCSGFSEVPIVEDSIALGLLFSAMKAGDEDLQALPHLVHVFELANGKPLSIADREASTQMFVTRRSTAIEPIDFRLRRPGLTDCIPEQGAERPYPPQCVVNLYRPHIVLTKETDKSARLATSTAMRNNKGFQGVQSATVASVVLQKEIVRPSQSKRTSAELPSSS
jgi:hypothetical protein